MDIDWSNESKVVTNPKTCAQDDQPASFKKQRPIKSKLKIYARPLIVEIQVDSKEEKTKRKEQKRQMKQDHKSFEEALKCWFVFIGILSFIAIDVCSLYNEFENSERTVEGKIAMDGFGIYSAKLATDVVGLAAAWYHHRYFSAGFVVVGYFIQLRINDWENTSRNLKREIVNKFMSQFKSPIDIMRDALRTKRNIVPFEKNAKNRRVLRV